MMHNHRAFLWKTAAGLGLIAALLLVIGSQTVRLSSEQGRNYQLVARAFDIISAIEEVGAHLRAADTAQRTFALTRDSVYEEQFRDVRRASGASLDKLQHLLEYSPVQQSTFEWFKILINEQIDIYATNIDVQKSSDSQAAQMLSDSVRNYSQMSTIADVIRQLEREEEDFLSMQFARQRENTEQTAQLVMGGLALSFLVIVFSGVMIFRDVHRRLAVERALGDSLNFERALVESAGYGIIATGPDCVITEFNRAAEALLGYAAHELVGCSTLERFHDPREVRERAFELSRELGRPVAPGLDALLAVPRLGRVEDRDWTLVRKDGERFPAQISITAIKSETGEINGYIAIANDITERKKIERLKTEFISTVSHELRTPLTSIRGSLGLIIGGISGELPPQAKELLGVANRNAERLGRLINDILDVEKIESGKMQFDMRRQGLKPLLIQAIESTTDFATQFNVTFQLHSDLPDAEVTVDADRFIQVMANLLSNAAKFSPANTPVMVGASRHQGMIRVSVEDRGKGIPFEFQSRIFEKFAQADGSDSRQKSGTGLGLNITKSMVERMGGRIGFTTAEGVGTTFHVDLPEAGAAMQPVAFFGSARVLICEDDVDIANLLSLMLKQGGFDADIVHNATDAKTRLRTGVYAALSLDLNLPDQNGLDLFRDLRADGATHHIPVVIVSAEADRGRRELNGAAINVIDWLEKPIDGARLLNAVRRAVQSADAHLPRVLHVEADSRAHHQVRELLSAVATVDTAGTIADALARIRTSLYNLILLDTNLPDGNGADLLSLLGPHLPVILLSNDDLPDDFAEQVAAALRASPSTSDGLYDNLAEIISRTSPPAKIAS